jgi:pre-mRNA-processing factor 6
MFGIGARDAAKFREAKPPPGYIPGLGRGAQGFVTRSDIGSSGALPTRGSGEVAGARGGKGADGRLFGDTPYDAEDAEADRVYREVDDKLLSGGKRRREEADALAAKKARLTTSRIGDTFDDAKQALASVTATEWEAIPDIGDRSLRYKKKEERFIPVTDALLDADRRRAGGGAMSLYADPTAGSTSTVAGGAGGGGGGGAGALTDIHGLSAARGQMLALKLDSMSDSVGGQTVADPRGYMTSLASQESLLAPGTDIADVKKAELLLASAVRADPKHAPGWIAAARLQEQVRNLAAARKLIRQGCENCPDDEDVWLEAVRLSNPAQARVVLADAVRALPHSVALWMRAAELEAEADNKKLVLRKALDLNPGSEKLWKAEVSLEAPEDARIMLSRAVECVPLSLDLWLALARLESYESAQKVLNRARAALPAEPAVWIAAAKLEEAQGKGAGVERLLRMGLRSLKSKAVVIDREAWMRWAEEAERAAAPLTAAGIIAATAEEGVDEVDRRRTWLADAAALEERGSRTCARAMYARALAAFPDREAIWLRAAEGERKAGDRAELAALLQRATAAVPGSEVLWLMRAKEAWLGGDVDGARGILSDAFKANPRNPSILLAAAKLELENGEVERSRVLLARARADAPTDRVWLKSALLERDTGRTADEERLLLEGVTRFPAAWKLWLMLGQVCERTGKSAAARDAFHAGLRSCPTSVQLWIAAAALEEALHGAIRARTLLETARAALPACPDLYLAAIRLERRVGQDKLAEVLQSKALQECPTSGRLWAEDILTAPRADQKRKCKDATDKCGDDPHVTLAIARLFWAERKYDRARRWFNRAVVLDADHGDAWIHWYAFELLHGTEESRAAVASRCAAADPRHGERWQSTSKRVGGGPPGRTMTAVEVLKASVVALRREHDSAAAGGSELFTQEPAGLAVDADVLGAVAGAGVVAAAGAGAPPAPAPAPAVGGAGAEDR